LQDEPGRKAEEALEAFVKVLLRYPSLRNKIVKMVETRTWKETPLEEMRLPTDLPSALKAIEIHVARVGGPRQILGRLLRAKCRSYSTDDSGAGQYGSERWCTHKCDTVQQGGDDHKRHDVDHGSGGCRDRARYRAGRPETESETEQEDESRNLEMAAESAPAEETTTVVEVPVGRARSSTQTPEGHAGDASMVAKMTTGDTTVPARQAEANTTVVVQKRDVRSSMEPLRTELKRGCGDGRRDPIRDTGDRRANLSLPSLGTQPFMHTTVERDSAQRA
jgi:hypothetical protein